MSSLWTTEVTPVTTGRFDFTGEDALTISSLSLLSGREAIVKLTSEEQDENKPYKIARLTSACPNYSLTVPVLETVTFSIESSDANATVSILGHVNPMDSDDDFDDDDDDEGEADLRKALLAQLGDPESAPELMVEESKPDENDSESGDAEIVQVHQSKEGGMEVEPLTTGTSEVDQSETPEEAESEAPKTPGQKRAMPEPADADSSSKEPKGPGKKAKKTGKKGPQEDSSTPIANPADTATPATAESPEKKKKTPKKSSPEEDKSGSALKRKMLQSGLYYDVQKAGKAGARTKRA